MRTKILTLALFLSLYGAVVFGQEPIAVVVPAGNPVGNVSMAQLREMFQCERSVWSSGPRVRLFSRGSGTPEHEAMLRAIYRVSASDYSQMWVMRQVRGETSCKPTELPSKGMTIEALRAFPGAIALIRVSEVTAEMKIVTVDGKKPESSEYPLK